MRLSKKVALVTGGASGLGEAISRRLVRDGASVIISDIDVELGKSVAAESGFTFIEHDVTNEAHWTSVIGQVEEKCGHLDILVNNAGITGPMQDVSPEHTSLERWKSLFSVNADSVFLGCRAAIPAMRRAGGGSIINISSVAGLLATPYNTAYGATKAVVRHLTKSVATYCAQHKLKVRCNSIHPGDVHTPLWDRLAMEMAKRDGITVAEALSVTSKYTPMGGFARVEDVAAAASFLASDESRHITGAKLVVDGGVINCDTFNIFKHLEAARELGRER